MAEILNTMLLGTCFKFVLRVRTAMTTFSALQIRSFRQDVANKPAEEFLA